VAVDDHCRIGLVRRQEPLERLPRRRHLALVERALAEDGGEAGRQEQVVAFTQGNVEALGEVEDHLAARPRAPRLDKTEMPCGDRRPHRDLELAEVAPLPPLP
jgi:hypothetical protein